MLLLVQSFLMMSDVQAVNTAYSTVLMTLSVTVITRGCWSHLWWSLSQWNCPIATRDIYSLYMNPDRFEDEYFIKGELARGRVEVCVGGRYGSVCDETGMNMTLQLSAHNLDILHTVSFIIHSWF